MAPVTRSRGSATSAAPQKAPARNTKKAGKPKQKKPTTPVPPLAPSRSTTVSTEDGTITDPTKVDHPYIELVHPTLSNAWEINQQNSMPFIFDALSPARIFLPGTEYSENEDFIPYTQARINKSTELDPETKLMQFEPMPYRYEDTIALYLVTSLISLITRERYKFERCLDLDEFFNWEDGQLKNLQFAFIKRKKNQAPHHMIRMKKVHIAYIQVVDQFVAEYLHAEKHHGHEAVRRQSYVMAMLDLFAKELIDYDGPDSEFRSKVLTPVLQRYLFGVPDGSMRTVSIAIRPDGRKPTIKEATEFYLSADPLEPEWIPNYRRNAIAIPQVRWHLRDLLEQRFKRGIEVIGDEEYYDSVLQNQVELMAGIAELNEEDEVILGMPPLAKPEVDTIVCESLESFFQEELKSVVRHFLRLFLQPVLPFSTTGRTLHCFCQ